MYLILLTVLCGLATVPNLANAARIPPHETVHEATHLTDVGSSNGSGDEFLYLIASDEGGAKRLPQDDFSVTPEGYFVDKNSTDSTEAHEISLGTPDIPQEVLHSVLDEIAFAVEDDPLVRETIKTSLKSGEIPVEVLIPGHKSNDENAILIEVFHLEDEEEEKSVDGLGIIDDVAATEEPITVTTTAFPTENNEFQTTDIPTANLLKLFTLVEKDVEQTKETVEEIRKRRNSEQTTNDKVETFLFDNKETERTHQTVFTAKVSSTTPAADSDLPIIISKTAKKLSGFDSNTESMKPMQVFDFVTSKYAESDEEGQLTTLPPQNYEASFTNENTHNININPSFIDLTDSEEDVDDDGNLDRMERGEIGVNGESNEDYVETTEIIDSSEDSLLHLPGVDKKRTQQPNGNEEEIDGNNEERKHYITDYFRLNKDGQLVKKNFQTREDLSDDKENAHNTEDRLDVATDFSEPTLGYEKRKDLSQRKKRQLDDSSNLSTVNEEAHPVAVLPLMLDLSTLEEISNSQDNHEELVTSIEEYNYSSNEKTVSSGVDRILSTEVSLFTTEGGSTITNEEETTTSPLDGDTFTTTLPSES